ncbi:MAG TPA: 2,3-diaminopropionate biosynthesis protein SbnB [Blastocatellia bacterium]|nr:2,3-diaminopropionate biosynthesis protein SbnB [Blastocatellia bacterium]
MEKDMLLLKGDEVEFLLKDREVELIEKVALAYQAHANQLTSLPHSVFLRFPGNDKNRIIALPAFLGDGFGVAGIKWVSSFPGNAELGLERASAVLILNSIKTGRPETIIEASMINAKRTAASAALAAKVLSQGETVYRVGLVGCGRINFETARFLLSAFALVKELVIFDVDAGQATIFKDKCSGFVENIQVAGDVREVLAACPVVSFATTALTPWVSDLDECAPGSVILHTSLRDLSPQVILSYDNVVDDLDHVTRAQTSVHLARESVGNSSFLRCTLGDILTGRAAPRKDASGIVVFSPFGLGILDLAVGKFCCDLARKGGIGSTVNSFFPERWTERTV